MKLPEDFDWGANTDFFRTTITQEMGFSMYETVFSVQPGDVVMDIGASVGPFLRTIKEKKPSICYAVEPFWENVRALINNTAGMPVCVIPRAITDLKWLTLQFDQINGIVQGITFQEIIRSYGIARIDFLKIDCEGAEFDIFEESFEWLKTSCRNIVCEFHLNVGRERFIKLRDNYFPQFKRVEVFSVDGANITSSLGTDYLVNYYGQIIVHIEV